MSTLRRTIVLTLSLLVLMSSIGLSVGVHLCGGIMQDMAFFHRADACLMEQKQAPLPCHGQDADAGHKSSSEDKNCCEDNLIVVDNLEDAVAAKVSTSLKSPDLQLMAVLYTTFEFLMLQAGETPNATPLAYAPPPIVRDIPVLVQSFLL